MHCPRCRGSLTDTTYEGVSIHRCSGCDGEWLDRDELQSIVQNWEKKFSPTELKKLKSIHTADFTIDPDEHTLKCPRCDQELERFNYASTSGVALDKCPGCGGIWLDENELEQVQILAEEWNKELANDLDRFGDLYQKTAAHIEDKVDRSVSVYKTGFLNWILQKLY